MKARMLGLMALGALTMAAGLMSGASASSMASISIAAGSAKVTLLPHWDVSSGLGGFTYLAQDLGLGAPGQFYSLTSGTIPVGGSATGFYRYDPLTGVAVAHADIGSKLTPDSYSALTSADPNLGFGAINLYMIHHRSTGDYFAELVPGAAVASIVADLKPMSGPGGPATAGSKGYFALTFAAANLGFGANSMYYLRSDPEKGTIFGAMNPALAGGPTAEMAIGFGGHTALAYAFADMGWGLNRMYYLRQDADTGYTILGTLHPGTGVASDIANLGSVFSTLAFFPADIGYAANQFYTTGTINPTWQSVSFAPIADRAISAGSFTVSPSASSGLALTLKLAYGSVGAASITGPVAGVFTVTPLSPGVITLQAIQAGVTRLWEYNALKQSFNATGTALLGFSSQPTPLSQIALVGSPMSFTAAATGTSTVSYQWRHAGANITGNASATSATLTIPKVQPADAGLYDVIATNSSGSIGSNSVSLAVNVAIPVISNKPLTADGRMTAPFNFTITASDNPTAFAASPLPTGLVINALTGAISGIPTTVGITNVVLGATNPSGTGTATLVITVVPSGAPDVATAPLRQTSNSGSGANFTVVASGTPAPTLQWQRLAVSSKTWVNLVEGSGYTGVNSSTLTVSTSAPAMSGDQFQVVITNAAGVATSHPVTLTVIGSGPTLMHYPSGMAVDATGGLFVANTSSNTIEKITAAGVVSTLAGKIGFAGSADGTGSTARFNQPTGVALDATGNLYVADSGNATIRRITAAGVVTTLAGSPTMRGNADGSGGSATFGMPTALALDTSGNVYVTDAFNATIRKVTAAGMVSTLAGSANMQGEADGTGTAARFNYPDGIVVAPTGTVYVADTLNNTIRKITPTGVVTTYAGSAGLPGSWDGFSGFDLFNQPTSVVLDNLGNLIVTDTGNSTIRLLSVDGTALTIAGNPVISGLSDGIGGGALLNQPHGLAIFYPGPSALPIVYIADTGNAVIRRLNLDGMLVTTLALIPDSTSIAYSAEGNNPLPISPTASGQGTGSSSSISVSGSSSGGGGAVSPLFLGLLLLFGAMKRSFGRTKPGKG
jgi:hypothetical protein